MKKKLTREERERLVMAYEQSGLPVQVWCEEHTIPQRTFRAWRAQIGASSKPPSIEDVKRVLLHARAQLDQMLDALERAGSSRWHDTLPEEMETPQFLPAASGGGESTPVEGSRELASEQPAATAAAGTAACAADLLAAPGESTGEEPHLEKSRGGWDALPAE